MIESRRPRRIMNDVRREDRALLRSNPSARRDAGRWTGASATADASSLPFIFRPQSEKPNRLGAAPPVPPTPVPPHRSDICLDLAGLLGLLWASDSRD